MKFCSQVIGFLLFILGQTAVNAQDPDVILPHHFTSGYINPAFTGIHTERYRFSVHVNDQWINSKKSINYSRYQTSAEMKIAGWKRDQISAGLKASHSVAGSTGYATSAALLSLAYTRQMWGYSGQKGGHFVSIGTDFGLGNSRIDESSLIFGDQINPLTGLPNNEPTNEVLDNYSVNYGDVHAGLLWYWIKANRFNASAGLSIYHLNRPNISFSETPDPVYMRWSGFLLTGLKLSGNLVLEPGLILHKQGPHSTFYFGSNVRLEGTANEDFVFKTGLWTQGHSRFDGIQLSYLHYFVGLGIRNMDFGFNFTTTPGYAKPDVADLRGLSFSLLYHFGKEHLRYNLTCPRF